MEVDSVDATPQPQRPSRGVTLRISQVVSACTFCKSRKIKCDGVVPACGCCTKFGRAATCSLADGSARPAHDYVVFLQTKIADAKTRLTAGRRTDPAPPGKPRLPPQPSFDFNDPSTADLPRRRARPPAHTGPSSTSTAIDTLIADIGALPISSHAHGHGHQSSTGDERGPTLSTVLLAAASKLPLLSIVEQTAGGNGQASANGQANAGTSATPALVSACLPDESAARKLIQHYIQQVYPRLPFFSLQGFWAQFQQVYSGKGHGSEATASVNVQSAPTSAGPAGPTPGLNTGYSYFTVLLVLAIATSSLSRSADSMISNQARRLFQAGLQFRESAILPNTIVGVQSLLFLIQFATLNPSVLDSWYLIGVGMRNCVDLGLHQDPDPSIPMTPSLLETRRRLWWSMYSFDRSLSIGCGRPTEIADTLIHVQLPSFRIESTATDVEVEGYVQRYRALQLQSEIYDALSQPPGDKDGPAVVQSLHRKLDAWQLSNRPERNRETLADSEWLVGKMLLFRPCRLLPERTTDELRELWVSARGFTALYRQLVETNGIFYVQVACEKVYWTGLVLLYSYWRLTTATTTTTSSQSLGTDPDAPQALHLWKATKDIAYILQTLSERWEDGKILAAQFDAASARVIELLDGDHSQENLSSLLPPEVVTLSRYASLVSIWASGADHLHGGLGTAHSEELQDLVAKMI